MAERIRVFVGTETKQTRAERVLEYSIRANTDDEVDVTFMRNGDPRWSNWVNHGPTGFTLFRFAIPELVDFKGYAIYLDCDMLVLGNIGELWRMRRPDRWVTHPDREGDCVSVIDCSAVSGLPRWPDITELASGNLRKWDVRKLMAPIQVKGIPDTWNSMDTLRGDTRLLHFTALNTQPWHPNPGVERYKPHPDRMAAEFWFDYEQRMLEDNHTV